MSYLTLPRPIYISLIHDPVDRLLFVSDDWMEEMVISSGKAAGLVKLFE